MLRRNSAHPAGPTPSVEQNAPQGAFLSASGNLMDRVGYARLILSLAPPHRCAMFRGQLGQLCRKSARRGRRPRYHALVMKSPLSRLQTQRLFSRVRTFKSVLEKHFCFASRKTWAL